MCLSLDSIFPYQAQKPKVYRLSDDTLEAGAEPLLGVGLLDLVGSTDLGLAATTLGDALTWAGHAAVEVHSVDTNSWVVLDTEIDVLGDTETEVTGLGEVTLAKLVLLDLKTTLKNLLGLWATDSDVNGDLLVTTDTEGTDSVASLRVDWSLTRQLLQNLGGTGKSVTRLSDGDVEDKLLELELSHGVLGLLGFGHFDC